MFKRPHSVCGEVTLMGNETSKGGVELIVDIHNKFFLKNNGHDFSGKPVKVNYWINVGDSIMKRSNSDTIMIFKQDSISGIIIDYFTKEEVNSWKRKKRK